MCEKTKSGMWYYDGFFNLVDVKIMREIIECFFEFILCPARSYQMIAPPGQNSYFFLNQPVYFSATVCKL